MHVKYTAITRNKLSSPMNKIIELTKLKFPLNALDYGCGRGYDAKCLNIDKYDKYWHPIHPNFIGKKYDVIFCNFVLNVVGKTTQYKILKDIKNLLRDNGVAYVTVRRDLKKDIRYKTYSQRLVFLKEKSIYKDSNYEIYQIN